MADALSETDIERIRRSVAMLSPGHPAALDREAALGVLTELQRLQLRDRRVRDFVRQVCSLLEESDGAHGT